MSLHADLLEQAEHLANRESKRPKQASLRRAVSTAYYALFHLLTADAALTLAPNVPPLTQHRIRRWFDHAEMKKICGQFLPVQLSQPLLDLLGAASPDLQTVARNFIDLQNARHRADYDLSETLTRFQTQQLLQLTRDAFAAWARIRNSAEANIFILSLVLWKNWTKDR